MFQGKAHVGALGDVLGRDASGVRGLAGCTGKVRPSGFLLPSRHSFVQSGGGSAVGFVEVGSLCFHWSHSQRPWFGGQSHSLGHPHL